jgi:biopolymer transport protein ExbD
VAGHNNGPSNRISGINVTPLVDIMLVLLIVFLVTAKVTLTPPAAIPLDLPKSATGETVQRIFAIVLGAKGEAFANGERLPGDDALLAVAANEHRAHPEARAVIDADGSVPHARMVHVLDVLAQAGIGQVAFGVNLSPLPAEPAK